MTQETVRALVNGTAPYRPRAPAIGVDEAGPVPPDEASTPPRRFKLLTSADLRAMPPMRWLVHSVLPEKGSASIFGPSGAGKGFLVIHLIAAVAEGEAFFGHRTRPCRVLYLVLEGQAGVPKRVAAWEKEAGRPFPESVHFVFESFRLTNRDDVLGLAATIADAGGADLIVIDTVNRAVPEADENSAQDSGRMLEAVKQLQELTGGLILLVHHSGKDTSKGMRGHSSVHAALDAVIEVSRSDDRRQWKSQKVKDDVDGEAHTFRLRRLEVGVDGDGDPITSCVVAYDDDDQEAPHGPRMRLPKGGNQKIVLDALGPLFRESRTFGKAGAPAMRPCLQIDEALGRVAGHLLVEPKRRKERAQQAITGLVAAGVVGSNEGWIWLI